MYILCMNVSTDFILRIFKKNFNVKNLYVLKEERELNKKEKSPNIISTLQKLINVESFN